MPEQRRKGKPLTMREVEIVELLALGWTNPMIAQELVVSVATIKTHVSHILEKLDVPTRYGAAELYRTGKIVLSGR